jgi:hypothetical protein
MAFLVAGPVAFFVVCAPPATFDAGAFFVAVAAPAFAAVAGFLAAAGAGEVFLAGGAVRFEAVVEAVVEDVFLDDDVATETFFAGAADLLVVGAAFFTDTAFCWAGRCPTPTDLVEPLFPAPFFLAPAGRDPDTLFAGVPLPAGVIVSSLTT